MPSSRRIETPSAEPDELIATSIKRFHQLFDSYDNVFVAWSGGKDSTAVLECGAIAAAEHGKKLIVRFFDEEVIPRYTVEFAERMRQREDIDFRWYCIPVTDNNAWDPDNPYWYPWDPEMKPLWVRSMPEWGTTEIEGYDPTVKRSSLEFLDHFVAKALLPDTTVTCIGRRMAESPVRGSIGRRLGWLQPTMHNRRFAAIASPIYDWNNKDIWNVTFEKGWDWNRAYMRMWQSGHPQNKLRIGPLFGEEPSSQVHLIRQWDPELWVGATRRVSGAQNLARYALTALMGRGLIRADAEVTEEAFMDAIRKLPSDKRGITFKQIESVCRTALLNGQPIPASKVLKIALRGDTKGSRLSTSISIDTVLEARQHGKYTPRGQTRITLEENLVVAAKQQYFKKHGGRNYGAATNR